SALPSGRGTLAEGRPNSFSFSSVSATSKVLPSRLISRQVRYRAPRVFSEAIGTTTCSYSRRKGSAPRRERACEMPLLPVARTVSSGLVSHWMPSSKQRSTSRGRLHVQRQRDHVVHHQMRWQFSLPDAGLTSRSQNRIDFLP